MKTSRGMQKHVENQKLQRDVFKEPGLSSPKLIPPKMVRS